VWGAPIKKRGPLRKSSQKQMQRGLLAVRRGKKCARMPPKKATSQDSVCGKMMRKQSIRKKKYINKKEEKNLTNFRIKKLLLQNS
jgi:hypothetical protein